MEHDKFGTHQGAIQGIRYVCTWSPAAKTRSHWQKMPAMVNSGPSPPVRVKILKFSSFWRSFSLVSTLQPVEGQLSSCFKVVWTAGQLFCILLVEEASILSRGEPFWPFKLLCLRICWIGAPFFSCGAPRVSVLVLPLLFSTKPCLGVFWGCTMISWRATKNLCYQSQPNYTILLKIVILGWYMNSWVENSFQIVSKKEGEMLKSGKVGWKGNQGERPIVGKLTIHT